MKKSVLFSLVVLVGFGLNAMEAEGEATDQSFPYDQLPQELQCTIARLVLPDQMKIAPKDAVQDIAEYAHDSLVNSVAGSPDGKWVVSGGRDKKVKIADAATGEVLHEYAHDSLVNSVAVSPDGKWVVSGGWDNKVKIADAATGEVLHEYVHDDYVYSVAVSPDGTWVVSGGRDKKVKIADAATGEVLHEYAHDSLVRSVAVSPDGTWVVSGGYDEKVKIKSIVPFLLAKHTLEKPNLVRYSLLKRVQESLLSRKEPLIIGQSDRETLDEKEMEGLKELLKIEKSQSKTKNPIWRLQMKDAPDASAGDGKSE